MRGHRRLAERRALQPLQGPGLDRDPRRRDGRPERARLRQGEGLRPREGAGLRLRARDRAGGDAAPRHPRPAPLLRQLRADAGAVRMRVPYSWLREYCDPGVTPVELSDRLVMTG